MRHARANPVWYSIFSQSARLPHLARPLFAVYRPGIQDILTVRIILTKSGWSLSRSDSRKLKGSPSLTRPDSPDSKCGPWLAVTRPDSARHRRTPQPAQLGQLSLTRPDSTRLPKNMGLTKSGWA